MPFADPHQSTSDPLAPRGVTVDCPAKINLHLRVGPARADGFHPLLTWMVTVGLADRLTVRVVAAADAPPVALACDDPALPADERNLVFRVLAAWGERARAAGGSFPAVAATLAKNTPAGAGLGGGSSDAAAALLAAVRLTPSVRTAGAGGGPAANWADWSAFLARFGSDIPFFLAAPSAACTGRGEVVVPTPPPAVARRGVLVLPSIHMPTPAVYKGFDSMGLGRSGDLSDEPDWAAWARLPAVELLPRLVNDLEPAAFAIRPDLDALRRAAEEAAGRPVRMSGSGSSLFTLFDTPAESSAGADAVRRHLAPLGVPPAGVRDVAVGVPVEVRDVQSEGPERSR
ncbi:MAG: ispE [Phycisphaerales bacterium]|nr:ispE [Phycisphaerales bacterium]